ncbi:MAG: phosphodiester glycosidase family protein [Clostridia bacterium]
MKKIVALLLSASLISVSANAETIYQNISESVVSKGITYQSSDTFSTDGWVKADILKVDLTDPDLELKVLTSPNGTSSLSTVKKMAEHYDTKAAVNGDFFNMLQGETNMLGMVYQDGELISTPSKDNFVSFAVTEDNRVIFDYFTFHGMLYAENTSLTQNSSCELYQINKRPITTGGITMITSAWGESVSVPINNYAMVTEPYGDNKYKMTSFSWGGESVSIPDGGAVFIANYAVNGFLNANFAIGDIIRVETSISPDVAKIKEASGGNTLIVKNGIVCPFTSNVSGKAQRTGMGLSQDGNTLYLVTVDGRQTNVKGFDQTDLARFMISLGCYSAINLDGGGSTTMVVQNSTTGEQEVKNTVSSLRSVSTSVGVISNLEPLQTPSYGKITLSKDTMVPGDSVDVTAVFFDENHNRVSAPDDEITITCSDPYAVINGTTVTVQSEGFHTIRAAYKNTVSECNVRVLGDIFAINIYPENITSSLSVSVTAYDKSGYSAIIPTSLLQFETTGDISFNAPKVEVTAASGTITAKYGNLTSVSVVNGEIYAREKDVKEEDLFEGYIYGGEQITVSGDMKAPNSFIEQFQLRARLNHLASNGDVYALSQICDPWNILNFYRIVNGFTERVIENSRIVTFSNTESSFTKTDASAWLKFKSVCENMKEANLVVMINSPLYNMDSDEIEVFNHFTKLLTDRGVNVFVVSTGIKSEVTVENGVRYLYLGPVGDCVNASYEYGLFASSPLVFTFKGDEIKYMFQ